MDLASFVSPHQERITPFLRTRADVRARPLVDASVAIGEMNSPTQMAGDMLRSVRNLPVALAKDQLFKSSFAPDEVPDILEAAERIANGSEHDFEIPFEELKNFPAFRQVVQLRKNAAALYRAIMLLGEKARVLRIQGTETIEGKLVHPPYDRAYVDDISEEFEETSHSPATRQLQNAFPYHIDLNKKLFVMYGMLRAEIENSGECLEERTAALESELDLAFTKSDAEYAAAKAGIARPSGTGIVLVAGSLYTKMFEKIDELFLDVDKLAKRYDVRGAGQYSDEDLLHLGTTQFADDPPRKIELSRFYHRAAALESGGKELCEINLQIGRLTDSRLVESDQVSSDTVRRRWSCFC